MYTAQYASPLGAMTLACNETAIIGVWFNDQAHFGSSLPERTTAKSHPLLTEASGWLDVYFSGEQPTFLPPLRYGGTSFRRAVWDMLRTIPYGETVTYGEIAKALGAEKMSAQAVGGAVGHNPISLMIPCHRVVGANGSLTGYAGGIERKMKLLELERADMTKLFIPAHPRPDTSRHSRGRS